MLNILLVDDEPSILLSVDEALRAEGHQVTTALDGLSAQAALTAKVFDVVISDVRLPKVDGFALFKKVRHEAPRTSFILMTAYATVPDAVGALKLGAVDYLPKPFDFEVLLKVLERIGHERSLSRDFVTQRRSAHPVPCSATATPSRSARCWPTAARAVRRCATRPIPATRDRAP